jgi:hypothetical protein
VFRPTSENPLASSDPQNAVITNVRNDNSFGVNLFHIATRSNIPDRGASGAWNGQPVIGEYNATLATSSNASFIPLFIEWVES